MEKHITSISGSGMFGPPGAEILRTPGPKKRTLGVGWLLYGFARACIPECVLEVGAGGSSLCILNALRHNNSGHLYMVDPYETGLSDDVHRPNDFISDEKGKPINHHHATLLRMLRDNSFEDISTFYHMKSSELKWNLPIDMLVVDGDHTIEGIKNDWVNFSKFIRPGGYALFHDPIGCLHAAGHMLQENIGDEFSMLIEPNNLGMAVIQRKFTVSSRMFWFAALLNKSYNEQSFTTPITIQNPRGIPGFLEEWKGRWIEEIKEFSKTRSETEIATEELIKSGRPQDLTEAKKFMEAI